MPSGSSAQALVSQQARRGDRKNEGRRQTHADGTVDLLRHADERAQAEELHQHNVVDQGGAQQQEQVFAHRLLPRLASQFPCHAGLPSIGVRKVGFNSTTSA